MTAIQPLSLMPSRRPLALRGAAPAATAAPAGDRFERSVPSELTTRAATLRRQALQVQREIPRAQAQAREGFILARGFNTLLNTFTSGRDRLDEAAAAALSFHQQVLPAALREVDKLASNGRTPEAAARLAALEARSRELTGAFATRHDELKASMRSYAGVAADVSAGVAMVLGASLTMTGVGAPVGASLFAFGASGFALGGAASVLSHAALDSQYDLPAEAGRTFLAGGFNSVALLFAYGAPLAAGASLSRTALHQGVGSVVGWGGTTLGSAVATEASGGFKPGAWHRIAVQTAAAAGTGFVLGGLTPIATHALGATSRAGQLAVGTSLSMATGSISSGVATARLEAEGGHTPGWEQRVKESAITGAGVGAIFGVLPTIGWKQ